MSCKVAIGRLYLPKSYEKRNGCEYFAFNRPLSQAELAIQSVILEEPNPKKYKPWSWYLVGIGLTLLALAVAL